MEGKKTKGRNFDFEKPRDRHFDFTKDNVGEAPIPNAGGEGSNKNRWKKPVIAAAIVALLAGGYGAYQLLQDKEPSVPPGQTSDNSRPKDGAFPASEEETSTSSGDTTLADFGKTPKEAGDQAPQEEVPKSGGSSKGTEESSESQPSVHQPTKPQSATPSPTGTLEQKAIQVIRGDFGNGQARKDRLGAEYTEIQSKVNEMYRNGSLRNR